MQKSEKNFKKGLLFIESAVKISFCTVAFCRPWILPKEVFGLPNIKSAKKRVLIAEARNARNKAELEQGKNARGVTFETKEEQKVAHDLFLLTTKPVLYPACLRIILRKLLLRYAAQPRYCANYAL